MLLIRERVDVFMSSKVNNIKFYPSTGILPQRKGSRVARAEVRVAKGVYVRGWQIVAVNGERLHVIPPSNVRMSKEALGRWSERIVELYREWLEEN